MNVKQCDRCGEIIKDRFTSDGKLLMKRKYDNSDWALNVEVFKRGCRADLCEVCFRVIFDAEKINE